MTVPESYVRRLESEIAQLRQTSRDSQVAVIHASHRQPTTPSSNEVQEQTRSERLIENSTTEHFVRRLKGVYSNPYQDMSSPSPFPTTLAPDETGFHESDAQPKASNYTYIPLENDNLRPKVLVKLPPHSYALYLIGQFESFMGSDYHWYQKKRFRAQIDAVYDPSRSQRIERTWLCCFSVVLVLGESYNDTIVPSFLIDNRTGISTDGAASTSTDSLILGIEIFKQALLLLRPSYEEPTIDQVEALNLIPKSSSAVSNTASSGQLQLSENLIFTGEGGFSDETLVFPAMHTVASLMLRYNQCIILLIRPLLLKQLHDLVHEQDTLMPRNYFASANTQCLQAAADSTAIQFALSKCHKIAKFGFWDSLHIFSSLTVHVVSGCLIEKRPTAFATGRPNIPYGPVRGLLGEIARV
ncbi:Pyruvate/Phosphoenolpyruvate kinase [Aspergillus affinis]|uniref:Pyruvate/Phosphoenolpyruvate kinase n=1 Tax=Aspergillus affinis TaxID=1070780 RepID=UPI0022FE490A|nr:Pyruvate/Phosphoenolpyruvate kinase [Aspergillus affinis]KAI9041800.1 Pyruvate/Phosphoenolpyruvate kinase [Aspergillus affinis]